MSCVDASAHGRKPLQTKRFTHHMASSVVQYKSDLAENAALPAKRCLVCHKRKRSRVVSCTLSLIVSLRKEEAIRSPMSLRCAFHSSPVLMWM